MKSWSSVIHKHAHVETPGAWCLTFCHINSIYLNFSKMWKNSFRGCSVHSTFSTEQLKVSQGNKRQQSSSTNQSSLECPMKRLFEVNESGFLLMVKFIQQKSTIMNLKLVSTIFVKLKIHQFWNLRSNFNYNQCLPV